jgi:hypothetical protein
MNTHQLLNKYNAIRLAVHAYHDLTHNTLLQEDVSPWNGKKMEEMSSNLLPVVTQSLQGGSPAQHPILDHAVGCTLGLFEFNQYF